MRRNFEWIPDITDRYPEGYDLARYMTVPDKELHDLVYVPEDDEEGE